MSKRCSLCYKRISSIEHAIEHSAEKHPYTLNDIINDYKMEVKCSDCEQAFTDTPDAGGGKIAVNAYCEDCREEGIRQIIVKMVEPIELLEHAEEKND